MTSWFETEAVVFSCILVKETVFCNRLSTWVESGEVDYVVGVGLESFVDSLEFFQSLEPPLESIITLMDST